MRILVTGGAGYIGSHTVRHLVEFGHEVVVLDDLSAGNLRAIPNGVSLAKQDLGDEKRLDELFARFKPEGVIHFAGFINVGESVNDPIKYYDGNTAITVTLLKVMKKFGVNRIVFSSTAATYGNHMVMPLTELSEQLPINPYGRSKLVVEWMLRDAAAANGFAAVALRYFNACGAWEDGSIGEAHEPETHLIPNILKVALGQKEKVVINGSDFPTRDGTCERDYIHVCDLASAHRLALEGVQPGEFRAYNVATGTGKTNLEVLEACRRVTGHPIPHEFGAKREGDPAMLYADPAKLVRELGWKPVWTNIDNVVESAWRWHKANPLGYQR